MQYIGLTYCPVVTNIALGNWVNIGSVVACSLMAITWTSGDEVQWYSQPRAIYHQDIRH